MERSGMRQSVSSKHQINLMGSLGSGYLPADCLVVPPRKDGYLWTCLRYPIQNQFGAKQSVHQHLVAANGA